MNKDNKDRFLSSLYHCTVMHHRLKPFKHRFVYKIYMFYLDLDEIELLKEKLLLISRNKKNIYSFYDNDHYRTESLSVKESIVQFARKQGEQRSISKVLLLTHLRTMGYVFNPVSFYFCYDTENNPVCAVAEVNNTFREMKLYYIPLSTHEHGLFQTETPKMFYVSPFIDLDVSFLFQLREPTESLHLIINDYQQGAKFFLSSLQGKREPLTGAALIRSFIQIPLITLKVITLIHYQALRLWLKKLPFHRKDEQKDLQKDIIPWNK